MAGSVRPKSRTMADLVDRIKAQLATTSRMGLITMTLTIEDVSRLVDLAATAIAQEKSR